MNQYWITNHQINKKVITSELQYYLGPDAHVRPYTKDGEDGFLITSPGPCLTDEQIDDICNKSKEVWEKQAAARAKKMADRAEKPLKRPLHQPIVVSRGGARSDDNRRAGRSDERRRDDADRRRSDESRSDEPWQDDRRR